MMHRIIMPDLGQTVAEGKIVRWRKKPGDKIEKGETLLEVETDKVTMEVEAFRTGYLRELLVNEGEMAAALRPIAIVTDHAEEPYDLAEQEAPEVRPAVGVSTASPSLRRHPAGRATAAPAAKLLARELGIDLDSVSGTGPGGLVTRKDVERLVGRTRLSSSANAMAALVTQSLKTIPHFYLTAEVDVAAADRWRYQWNTAHPHLPATFNDIFVRAASKVLRDVPRLNVRYDDGRYESNSTADVLLVVALESGLVLVPFADPSSQGWEEYLHTARKLLEKAKQGRVTEGARRVNPTLAISNLGMFKVKEFAAIIPPSCTAILAVGAVRDAAVVVDRQVVAGRIASFTLSADHRVVDGVTAAKFMERFQEHLNAL